MRPNYPFNGRNIVLNFKRKIIYDYDRVKDLKSEYYSCRSATLDERRRFIEKARGRDRLTFAEFGFKYRKSELWENKRSVKISLHIDSSTLDLLNHLADLLSLEEYEDVVREISFFYLTQKFSGAVDPEVIEKRIASKYKTDLSLLKTQIETIIKFL